MYIIAIAWLYVTLLMAITETSWVAGVMTFVFYGLCPLAVLLYLMGTPERRRRKIQRSEHDETQATEASHRQKQGPG